MAGRECDEQRTQTAGATTSFDDGARSDIFFERFDLGLDFYFELASGAMGIGVRSISGGDHSPQ